MGEGTQVSVRVCFSEKPSNHHAAIPSPMGTLAVTPPQAARGAAAMTEDGEERDEEYPPSFPAGRSVSAACLPGSSTGRPRLVSLQGKSQARAEVRAEQNAGCGRSGHFLGS